MDIRRTLIDANGELPERKRNAILKLGAAAVEPLLAVFCDGALAQESAPGDGWAPVLAAELLGELGDPRAVGPLLHEFRSGQYATELCNAAALALPKLGELAVTPILEAYREEASQEERCHLASLMADLGVRDDRIWAALCETLPHHVEMIAGAMGAYGDGRAVPLLLKAFDRVSPDDVPSARDLFIRLNEIGHAVEETDGELGEDREQRLEEARAGMEDESERHARMERDALDRRDTGVPARELRVMKRYFVGKAGVRSVWNARGFLAAVACAPALHMPSAWLPTLLPSVDNEAQAKELVTAVLMVQELSARAVDAPDATVLCPRADDVAAVQHFCAGFLAAAELDEVWVQFDEVAHEMATLQLLAEDGGKVVTAGQRTEWVERMRPRLIQELDVCIEDICDALTPAREDAMVPQRVPVRVGPKVGRNDPCPCGSDKKYKRCCGRPN